MKEQDNTQYLHNIRPPSLALSGLIGISLFVVSTLIPLERPDRPEIISVVAFAFALPLLAVSAFNSTKSSITGHKGSPLKWHYYGPAIIGIISCIIGLSAAFWHISCFSTAAFLISGVVAIIIFVVNR